MKTTGDWNGIIPGNGDRSFTGTPGDEPSTPSPYITTCEKDKVYHPPLRYERTICGMKLNYCSKCVRHRNSSKKGRWNTTHYSDEHTCRPVEDKDTDISTPVSNSAQDYFSPSTYGVSFED